MNPENCLQCGQITNVTYNRIIRDSCGHMKCRMCLLRDDRNCSACSNQPRALPIPCETKEKVYEILTNVPYKDPNKITHTHHNSIIVISDDKKSSVVKPNKEIVKSSVIVNKPISCIKVSNKQRKVKKNAPKKHSPKIIPSHIQLESTGEKDPKSYLCTICDKRFHARSQILYHSYCNSTKPHSCSMCQKTFVKKSQLKYHMDVHLGNKPFVCDTCESSFYVRSKLIRHLTIHSGVKDYKCDLCESKFNNGRALKIHNLIHSGLKPHVCKTCGSCFRNTSNLRKHEISHTGSAVKHTCLECGKSYKRKSVLVEHSKVHSKQRPWSCPTCSRTFYSKKDLNRHQLTHTDVNKFQCQMCKSTFRRKDNLERHFRNTHPDADPAMLQNTALTQPASPLNLTRGNTSSKKTTKATKKTNNKNSTSSEPAPPKIINTVLVTPKNDLIENERFNSQSIDEDYYKKKSEFRNYENYIPKEFNSFSTHGNHLSLGNVNNIHSNLTPVRHIVQLGGSGRHSTAGGSTERGESESMSRSKIIEANTNRQSVIFNPPTCDVMQTPVINNMQNSFSDDNNYRSIEAAESIISLHTHVTNSFQNNLHSTVRTEIAESHKTHVVNSSSKAQKKTINVHEVYKQMFPNGSQVNFISRRMNSAVRKEGEADNKTSHKSDIVNTSENDYDRSSKPSYHHKKVHYDFTKISSKTTNTSDNKLQNVITETNSYKEPKYLTQNHQRTSSLVEKKDPKSYISPESLELYKKILIPSYKGSNETSTSKNHEKTNTAPPYPNMPPLTPISGTGYQHKDNVNHTAVRHESEELPVPQLVPLGSKTITTNVGNVTIKHATSLQSTTPSHSTDIHWRRRLAHSSNQDF